MILGLSPFLAGRTTPDVPRRVKPSRAVLTGWRYIVFLHSTHKIVPHRPPLTAERLAQIWDAHPEPIVLELLWETHRLRANQIRHFPRGQRARHRSLIGLGMFPRELDTKPCLTGKATLR
jgi:hypothetical protein